MRLYFLKPHTADGVNYAGGNFYTIDDAAFAEALIRDGIACEEQDVAATLAAMDAPAGAEKQPEPVQVGSDKSVMLPAHTVPMAAPSAPAAGQMFPAHNVGEAPKPIE